MKVLAIGATGFLGPHVAGHLTRMGHEVTVFHRGETEANLPDSVRQIRGDRNDLPEHQDAFETFAPDVVLDVIPYTEAQARQAVDVFSGLAGRLVVLSSSDVYRNYDGWRGESTHSPDGVPLDEDAPLRENLYPYRGYDGLNFEYAEDYDKIRVEQVVREAPSLPATVLRLPKVYGPRDTQHWFASHLKRMVDGRPFILLGEKQANWRWTHGYVENVAATIARAVVDSRASARVYNVGEWETPTEANRIQALGDAVGWEGQVITLPEKDLPGHLQAPFDWSYKLETDTSRIREELGHEDPVDFADALQRTAEWERPHLSEVVEEEQLNYEAEEDAVEKAV